jgi:hypothetical protein
MTPDKKKQAEELADDVMRIVQRVAGRRLFQALKMVHEENIEPLEKENEAMRHILCTIQVNMANAVKAGGKDDIYAAILDYLNQELTKLGLMK